MTQRERKEIGVDLLGLSAWGPFKRHNSSPREAMFTTHIGQAPVVEGAEHRKIITGVEPEYAKYDFNIKFPKHVTVLRVIRKYPTGIGQGAIRHNPLTTIIYEDYYDPHKTIGIIHVPEFESYHQDFGFPLKKNKEVWEQITKGATFEQDTVIAASPAVLQNGLYGVGVEAETAFMSLPGTIEDGFVLSESFLKRMTPYTYGTLIGSWGRKAFPLNLYGDDNHYKPFPDIGDVVREDGLVFALRDIDDDLGVAEMTPRALREVDHGFDRPLYGKPGARVVDIQVFHDDRLNPSHTPVGMDTQARRYYDATCTYYRTLLEEYNRLRAKRGTSLKITEAFNQLLVEAQIFLPVPADRRKLSRMYRLDPLDEWRVEVTFEYRPVPTSGYKFTDFLGGKGVNIIAHLVCKG